MANIARRPDGRWRPRYRDAAGKEHARHFQRKVDAQRWLDGVTAAVETGTYVDPRAGRITVGEWAEKWLEGQAQLKPTTRSRYRGILDRHVLPHWAAVQLIAVSHADVQAWVAAQRVAAAPATVRKHFRVLSLILDLAVRDGRLPRNPCHGVNLPRLEQARRRYLTHAQVHRLADEACRPRPDTRLPYREREIMASYRLVVLVLAYCGLRWGELAALKVKRVDLQRRRIEVAESVVEVDGVLTWGTPKGYERRSVPVPAFLADELRGHLDDRAPDDLVFTGLRGGGVLRNRIFRRAGFDRAATAGGLDGLVPHELRHTAASLAVSSGANVKAVQRILGHASAAMTLDTYADLFDDDLDAVAEGLDQAARAALALAADFLRTEGRSETEPGPHPPAERAADLRLPVVPPAGFEPAPLPPEGSALSPELRGLVVRGAGEKLPAPDRPTRRRPSGCGQGGAAPGGEHRRQRLRLRGLRLDDGRGQPADGRNSCVRSPVLRHGPAPLVVADHQPQELDVEGRAGQRPQLGEFGVAGHPGHGRVRVPGGTHGHARHPRHRAAHPRHRCAAGERQPPQGQPALHPADLVVLGGGDVEGDQPDGGIVTAVGREVGHLHSLEMVMGHVTGEAGVDRAGRRGGRRLRPAEAEHHRQPATQQQQPDGDDGEQNRP